MKAGQSERQDYEYCRQGTANSFMFFAPLQNWRHVKVTEHRTKVDWAWCMHDLVHVQWVAPTYIAFFREVNDCRLNLAALKTTKTELIWCKIAASGGLRIPNVANTIPMVLKPKAQT